MIDVGDGVVVDPDYLPGWLLRLLDSQDAYEIGYAERNCSDRLNRRVLAWRVQQLEVDDDGG